jgi:tRNA(fMet)-specific endonuclease VapC
MTTAILDTDILSEVLRGRNERLVIAADTYLDHQGHYTISSMTVAEVVRGLVKIGSDTRLADFRQFISKHEVISIGTEEAILAATIHAELERAGLTIGHFDPFIGATALTHNLKLVTGNTKHFNRIIELGYPLELQNWRDALPNG